jgi:hypothetical protein
VLFAFPQAGRFALEPAQVVELRAAYAAGANQVDVIDHGRVDGENALDTLAEADLAHRDGLAESGVVARDDSAFERLQPLLVTFLDAHVDANRVPGPELRMSLGTDVLADEIADKSVLHTSSALYRAPISGQGATFLFFRETPTAAIA